MVVEHLVGYQVVNDDLVPVATVARDGVGGIATIFRKVEALQCHSSVLAQSVGVKHHASLTIKAVFNVEHALVL